jgi:hypothetical protein
MPSHKSITPLLITIYASMQSKINIPKTSTHKECSKTKKYSKVSLISKKITPFMQSNRNIKPKSIEETPPLFPTKNIPILTPVLNTKSNPSKTLSPKKCKNSKSHTKMPNFIKKYPMLSQKQPIKSNWNNGAKKLGIWVTSWTPIDKNNALKHTKNSFSQRMSKCGHRLKVTEQPCDYQLILWC